ncbi:MAG: glycine--tRNA ligase subunit beta [Nitrospirae bacterium]|nr:glycine--tRNA ligase subunit beta [Nitrospirota bacterium]
MKPFLLEIGTEEIPARFISRGLESLKERFTQFLNDKAIDYGRITEYATPRRLAIFIDDVSEKQKDRVTELTGPPKRIAFDESGAPTNAAIGFAKSLNLELKDIRIVKTERGEYLSAVIEEKGEMTKAIFSSHLPKLIESLQFPKAMRWGNGTLKFVRPIHWILALFGSEIIPFELDGLKSGDISYGHRFISPEAIKVNNPSLYLSLLLKNHVVANTEERRRIISDGIKKIESENNCKVHEDIELLDTVTSLVEYPSVILGSFNQEYLSLPKELPVTVMKTHQKYFSVEDAGGNLLPHFIVISNTKEQNNETVRKGAERVLKARLEDARFYFVEDQKIPLWDYVEKLKTVTFQEKLGSIYEKIERIAFICSFIADKLNFERRENLLRTAMLCKADLVTGIVREFPELQGYMGMTYALNSGEDKEVASGIYEHYLPRYAGDSLPSGEIGAIISLADKVDNIASFFLLDLIPSGSEDPFALRRQAAGVITTLKNKEYPFSLDTLIETALNGLEGYAPSIKALKSSIIKFFLQRLEGILLTEGYSHDIIQAAIASKELNLRDLKQRIELLSALQESPRFPELLTAAKRVCNILSKAGPSDVKKELLRETAEKELYRTTMDVIGRLKDTDFKALFELKDPINNFFDAVMVMDKDVNIKLNRIALLFQVKKVFDHLGDFSKIEWRQID